MRYVDCYGLARAVRHEQFGLPLLPAFAGIDPNDKPTASASFAQVIADLTPGEPRDGALVLCWAGRLAIHCGVVVTLDGRPGVLEADDGVDVRMWISGIFRYAILTLRAKDDPAAHVRGAVGNGHTEADIVLAFRDAVADELEGRVAFNRDGHRGRTWGTP